MKQTDNFASAFDVIKPNAMYHPSNVTYTQPQIE